MSNWENISDVLTGEGIKKLKVGQVLIFDFEGSPTHLKIMRMPTNGNVWARRTSLTDPEQMRSHYGHIIDTTNETVLKYGSPWCSDCERPIAEAAI